MDFVYIIFIVLCVVALFYLRNGAIPVPTRKDAILEMLKMAQVKPGMKVAELGSGDGRIVMAFAKAGAEVDGYEINPLLSFWSRHQISKNKISNARIYTKSFWSADLSAYDVVIVFGMTHIMNRLRVKFERELKPGAIVLSNIFEIPDWIPIAVRAGVRLYRR